MEAKKVLYSLTPPIVWQGARRVRRGATDVAAANVCQNVSLALPMNRLHEDPFSSVHARFAQINRSIDGDTDVTRMRTYFVTQFAQIALQTTGHGTFLTAGVSFAVAPKVVAEMVDFAATGRRWIMIDPLDGRGDPLYNTDIAVAQDGWNPDIPTTWVQLPLLNAVEDVQRVDEWGPLAFLHLNTTDFPSEFAALETLTSRMLPGAIAIIDVYGWESLPRQHQMDAELDRLGLRSFELPTLQLVVMKPLET